MSNNSDKTLIIPDIIKIEFRDKNNAPLKQENILIGIKTYANHKNNIDISPFVTDKEGHLRITKKEIETKADEFISLGLMDYVDLQYAKPNVELYFWGNKALKRFFGYETDPALLQNLKTYIPGFDEEDFKRQRIEQQKEDKDYSIFEKCFNLSTSIEDNLILAKDNWDKPQKEISYMFKIPV